MGMRENIVRALMGKAAAPLAGKPGGVWEGGIRAYHSSPHDFDKVDFSRLHTGEGANVYGAGHYMAENPAVSGQGGQYWQQFMQRFPSPEERAAKYLKTHEFDREAAIAEARANAAYREEAMRSTKDPIRQEDWRRGMEMDKAALETLMRPGPVGPRTYEMNLRAKPEELLDWDTPLPRQSAFIKDALDRIGIRKEMPNASGNAIYDALMNRGMLTEPVSKLQMRASETLAEAGIPGIRYLDEGSRGLLAKPFAVEHVSDPAKRMTFRTADDAERHMTSRARAYPDEASQYSITQPKGTYNYVGTDPSKLEILAKYGVAGGAAIPPTLGAFTDQSTYEAR